MRWAKNGVAVSVTDLPVLSPSAFHEATIELCQAGARLSALCPLAQDGAPDLLGVLCDDENGRLALLRAALPDRRYPALSAALPEAQAFERELMEQHRIVAEGHPWPKPLLRHAELEASPGSAHPFFRVEGEGIHEVAVGPVHAGIIEPGHFRFQCFGETVRHLEIQLGYQHRGAEALMLRASSERRLVVAESVAGDTVIGHGLAHCQAMEALAGATAPLYAEAVRAVALELERLANHVGDLGALCNDVGYLPGASWFGRLRGEFLNMLMELTGNRFGRGLLRLGGIRFAVDQAARQAFVTRLEQVERDLHDTADMTFDAPTVGTRFEHTGIVARETAEELGLVGPVARASGCDRDARRDHPTGAFCFAHIPVATVDSGDVMARALVRWLETQRSLTFVKEQLGELPEPTLASEVQPPAPGRLAVSVVEGWRGEIVHLAVTAADGRLSQYKIVDPSFHNWFGLAVALRGNQISDFPLCNKSFNLSYAGHDR